MGKICIICGEKEAKIKYCRECREIGNKIVKNKRERKRRKTEEHKKYHRNYQKKRRKTVAGKMETKRYQKIYRERGGDEVRKRWKRNNPDKVKNYFLKKNYGITYEEYLDIAKTQNYCCGICGEHKNNLKRDLCVDHDHETGEIRGLLCNACNRGLGAYKDDIDILCSAISYLRQY